MPIAGSWTSIQFECWTLALKDRRSNQTLTQRLKACHSTARKNSVRRQRHNWTVIGIVALVLIWCLPTFQTERRSSLTVNNKSATGSNTADAQSHRHGHQSLDTVVQDAGAAWLVLAKEATESVTSVVVLIPNELQPTVPQGTEPSATSNWMDEWQDNLKPIGREVENAFNFLIRVAPIDSSPAT